ncbi:MAG TPA: ABC transporter permease [Longimicrobiales bacterium]|nr:ABC transporter permease [Longimicrobiales bacterium]
MIRRLLRRLQVLFHRRDLDREIDNEMRLHVELEAAELVRTLGLTAAEARRRALVAFGGQERMRQRSRDVYGMRWLEDLSQDARQGLRLMRRTPGFSATAVLTLALGIGATTAIFSVVDGALLKPLPYPDANRLVSIWGRYVPESGFDFAQFTLSPPEYQDYRDHTVALEDVAAYEGYPATVIPADGMAVPMRGAAVTANLFDVLRVRPGLGRTHTPVEAVPGAPGVVIISHALWRREFGADTAAIGRTVRINGGPAQVIGVMPSGFAYPSDDTDIWTPLAIDPRQQINRSSHFLRAVGRIADGASLERARSEMDALMMQWRATYPDVHTGHFLFLRPLIDDVVGNARLTLLTVLGMVGFVLLIVCANVVNLLLARGEARQSELAVRSALGASRVRLIRQFVVEGAVLSLLGGLAGLGIAWLAVDLTLTLGGDSIPRADNIALDGRALLFSAVVVLFATAIFALVPVLALAVNSLRGAFADESRSATAGRGRSRLRHALVAAQVALAVVVVIGAGLTVRSFDALTSTDAGFTAGDVITATVYIPSGEYPEASDVVRVYEGIMDRLAHLPGARSAAVTSTLPLGGGASNNDFRVGGVAPPAPGEPAQSGDLVIADPGYVETFGVELLEGRFFEQSDHLSGMPVAVVNGRLAGMLWPGESALGERIRIAQSGDSPWLTVVGVVDNVQFRSLSEDMRPAWYLPLAQMPLSLGQPIRDFTVAVRAESDAAALAPSLHAAVQSVDPTLAVARLRPLRQVVAESVRTQRFTMTMLGLFAALALVLGAIGIYGVLAYTVARRTRELGICMVLGAGHRQLSATVLVPGLRMIFAGLGMGLAAALLATRLMEGLLFGVSTVDPATYAAVSALVCVVALAACLVPLGRALKVDPVRALRAD